MLFFRAILSGIPFRALFLDDFSSLFFRIIIIQKQIAEEPFFRGPLVYGSLF